MSGRKEEEERKDFGPERSKKYYFTKEYRN
jgi:hypothetical protein